MPTPARAQTTAFSKDVLGRYTCNGLDEALRTTDASIRPDARPFDVIVIGAGSFGAVVAQHLFSKDSTHDHRILVLEGGPFLAPEHVQNLPMIGLNVPGATSIQELRTGNNFGPDKPREEVWGLSWHSATPFTGLAYCLGGRSLYFGGWSPRLLDPEMRGWPSAVRNDLDNLYFEDASRQIGTSEANDFIFGDLHATLRQMLFAGVQARRVDDAIPLAELPVHLDNVPPGEEHISKLEAPLAVQSRTAPGLFPFNKFSAMPLLMRASRAAWSESNGDDFKRRLMVVPNCHVTRLSTDNVLVGGQSRKRVVAVETAQGSVPVPPGGIVLLGLGTIENARLALLSFPDVPHADLTGRNLMAHLRSNITIRVPRTSLPNHAALPRTLLASALFVKGRVTRQGQLIGHFHLQITAAGLGPMGADSEAELFKKIPDIDTFDRFASADDTTVVITIRGIGEMQPGNPDSRVRLDPELDEFQVARAFVALAQPVANGSPQSATDAVLWDAMDRASDQVAKIFANGADFEVFTQSGVVRIGPNDDISRVLPYRPAAQGGRRDGLGTTHHESGTCWMGIDPSQSVTNEEGRFHGVSNAFVVGPALFPSMGSPNPMLTCVALARRLGDHWIQSSLQQSQQVFQAQPGFEALFDGTEATFNRWQVAGQGNFSLRNGVILAEPGGDLGLFYNAARTFGDFTLRLEFMLSRGDDNSGVFVRFRDPRLPVPDRNTPGISYPYQNQAYVAVDTGFEVQIDELARGNPDGLDQHRTGAIYGIPIGLNPGQQDYRRGPALQPGVWNSYEIEARGNIFTVRLNGQQTARFENTDAFRGKSPAVDPSSGFIGIQSHTGRVAFRRIEVRAVQPAVVLEKKAAKAAAVGTSRFEIPPGLTKEQTVRAEDKPKTKTKKAGAGGKS